MKDIVFIISSNDFHAIDKFNLTTKFIYPRNVILLTDSISYTGMPKLISDDTKFEKLFIIDKFLIKRYGQFGNFWRNFIKVLFIPIQIYKLKKFHKKNFYCIYHATPIYYMFLCYLANIKYIGTPQASEILIRPNKSLLYKYFAIKALKNAKHIIVDSLDMKEKVYNLSGVNSLVFKNGFDLDYLLNSSVNDIKRTEIISIRGFSEIYRIDEILKSRKFSNCTNPINFVYPAADYEYKIYIKKLLSLNDKDLGRLNKYDLYDLMKKSYLAISIPISDSSPRSVYECIFAGAIVAVVYSTYIDELPSCMKNRIFIIDLKNKKWLEDAINYAKIEVNKKYIPSKLALDLYDQERAIKYIINSVYN